MLEKSLLEMWKAKLDAIEAGQEKLEEEKIAQFRLRFKAMVEEGLQKFPKPKKKNYALGLGKMPEGKTRSLLLRHQERENEVFRFIEDFDVPYSNNQKEVSEAPRSVKLSPKPSVHQEGWTTMLLSRLSLIPHRRTVSAALT